MSPVYQNGEQLLGALAQMMAPLLSIGMLLFMGLFLMVFMEILFNTWIFKKTIGKEGPLADYVEIRPYVALVLGLYIASEMPFVAMHYAMAMPPTDLLTGELTSLATLDTVMTGVVLGSLAKGCKFAVKRIRTRA